MTKPAQKPSYHKDNLRGDLLDAARQHLADHGHASLSLRALAQQVGVSTAAPYHHFSDRRALLLALAVEGFEDLLADARAVMENAETTFDRFVALGVSFVSFAQTKPHLIALMYESELTSPILDPELRSYQDQGYAALLSVIGEARPDSSTLDQSLRVMAYWSTIYGYAVLRNKLMLQPFEPSDVEAAAINMAVISQGARAALND